MERDHLEIRPYAVSDLEDVILLWKKCGLVVPWNDPKRDIERKMAAQPDLFLVGRIDGEIVSTVMCGYEGHRGWVNYLSVSPEHQRKGIGSTIMEAAHLKLERLGCPKVNLQVRTSNNAAIAFYEKLGYAVDDVISLGKRLVDDVCTL